MYMLAFRTSPFKRPIMMRTSNSTAGDLATD